MSNISHPQPVADRPLLYLYFLLALTLPWSLALMQVSLGLVIAYVLYLNVRHRRVVVRADVFVVAVAIYLLLRILSALFSMAPAKGVLAVINTDWVLLSIPMLATVRLSEAQLRRVLLVLMISATGAVCYGFFQFATGIDVLRSRTLSDSGRFFRATGGYNNSLTYAGNMMLLAFFAFNMWLLDKTSAARKWGFAALFGILVAGVITSFSRGVLLMMVAALLLNTLFINRKMFLRTAAGVAIVVVLIVATVPAVQDRLISIFDFQNISNANRLNLWASCLAIVKAYPVFGTGPASFGSYFYYYQVPGIYDATQHAHNDFINMATLSGVPTLLAWLLIWGIWIRKTLASAARLSQYGLSRALPYGAVFGITGILAASVFQCYYTDLENNIMMCFVVLTGIFCQQFSDRSVAAANS